MNCYATLILLLSGCMFNSCTKFPLRIYYFVNLTTSWTNAQQYCRSHTLDLATIYSMNDTNILSLLSPYTLGWIGLNDDPKSWKGTLGNDTNSWRWSTTGETGKTAYQVWLTGSPSLESGYQICVVMEPQGGWIDVSCDSQYSFVCYSVTNQNQKTYVFISNLTTWNSAQAYCRQHYTDLAMIENSVENNEVYNAKQINAEVWIGLYRLPWTWSDKSQSSFRNWQSGQPTSSSAGNYCAAVNPQHEWANSDCNTAYPFFCYQVLKLKTMVKMTIRADANITNPAINGQILQQVGSVLTSQMWTNFTLQWKIQPKIQQ